MHTVLNYIIGHHGICSKTKLISGRKGDYARHAILDGIHSLLLTWDKRPSMNPLLDAALSYAASGWLVFPCQPRSKIPATAHGFKDATRDDQQIRAWWTAMPDANVAIATGEDSGLFVLDVDHKTGRTLEDALAQFPETLPEHVPTVRTGGGGLQYFFAFPKGRNLSISGGRLGLGIDTRGNGGYVVAPPSIHPHGTAYQWIDSDEVTTLPPTPAWIITQLEKQRAGAVLQSAEKLTGGRHNTLMTAAALMRGIGMVSAEIQAALMKMVDRLDLSDGRVISPDEVRKIAEWVGDKDMGMVNIESVTEGNSIADTLLRQIAPAAKETLPSDEVISDPGPFPSHVLQVPGIIDSWTTWINDTSYRRQPILALAAVITACGALIGRRLKTESGGRANIYALGLCETGGGKDRARTGVKEVMLAAGADLLLGPEDFASEAGLTNSLVVNPCQLYQVDEIGKLLMAISNPAAAPHLAGIISALLKLYSSAGSLFKGKSYADTTKNPVIQQPHVCLYGTAVPDATWAALGASSVDDGLLARLWAFVADDHRPPRQRAAQIPPPLALIETIRTWHLAAPQGLASIVPTPAVVPYTPEARDILEAFEAQGDAEELRLRGNPLGKLWTRASQKADQLVLVFAWSAQGHGHLVIDAAAATWATSLANYLTRSMLWHVHRHVARNHVEAELKAVLRLIEQRGEVGITQNHLTRCTQWLSQKQRKDIIASLTEGGQIVTNVIETGGRFAERFVSTRFREK